MSEITPCTSQKYPLKCKEGRLHPTQSNGLMRNTSQIGKEERRQILIEGIKTIYSRDLWQLCSNMPEFSGISAHGLLFYTQKYFSNFPLIPPSQDAVLSLYCFYRVLLSFSGYTVSSLAAHAGRLHFLKTTPFFNLLGERHKVIFPSFYLPFSKCDRHLSTLYLILFHFPPPQMSKLSFLVGP